MQQSVGSRMSAYRTLQKGACSHLRRQLRCYSSRDGPISSTLPAAAMRNPQNGQSLSMEYPLAVLPLSMLMRSYVITTLSASPVILQTGVKILHHILKGRSIFTNIDRNPILRSFLKKTFYAQYCAGETKYEVRETVERLKAMGYSGIILEYALEVLEDGGKNSASEAVVEENIKTWRTGLLDTINIATEGDSVGLKWSGMGPEALRVMKHNEPPSKSMIQAMTDICDAAVAKKVWLLPAAEPQNVNAAVDTWDMDLAKKYNKPNEPAVIYNTYQAYLKTTPRTLAKHLALALENNYTLGVKLVRGAYLDTEQRDLIWSTKEETDDAFDALAQALLKQEYNDVLQPASKDKTAFPAVELCLATHNNVSVQKARKLRDEQAAQGRHLIRLSYAQLQGMADEVSCELVKSARNAQATLTTNKKVDVPRTFKCIAWGQMSQTIDYLLRRAAENKDAMSRTKDTRIAMAHEIWRRTKAIVGLR